MGGEAKRHAARAVARGLTRYGPNVGRRRVSLRPTFRMSLHKRIKTLIGFRVCHRCLERCLGRYGIIPRRKASSCISRGAWRASTINPSTWISQAIGLSPIRLGSVQCGSACPEFNNFMIAVDFAPPVLVLRPKCRHSSSARMCGVWLLSNRKLTLPTD